MVIRWSILLFYAAIFTGCANIQGISGGPEDLKPPKRIAELSSPDEQIRFNSRELFIRFDEWIRLDNPNTRITISPATEFPLEFKLKGKTLFIRLNEKEVLRPNTTYTLQFGEAIRDITKGNILSNFKYAFSTGDYIDSLKLLGTVVDALTQKAQGKILVSLYKNLDDTAFERTKPFYLTWSNDNGSFTLENLSPGEYKIYALGDKNQNYFFDQKTEAIAFHTDIIRLTELPHEPISLNMSLQDFPLNSKEQRTSPGFLKQSYTRIPRTSRIEKISTDSLQYAFLDDSLLLWNASVVSQPVFVYLEDRKDTLQIPAFNDSLRTQSLKIKLTNVRLLPGVLPAFMANVPVSNLDLAHIKSTDTLNSVSAWLSDTSDPRIFYLKGNYSFGVPIALALDSGAIKSLFATHRTRDTLRFSYADPKSLSSLSLETKTLEKGRQYILQLLSNDKVAEQRIFQTSDSLSWFSFGHVLPGTYRLRMVEDVNRNQRWDHSDFKNKLQAEPVRYYDIPELRADWELRLNLKN